MKSLILLFLAIYSCSGASTSTEPRHNYTIEYELGEFAIQMIDPDYSGHPYKNVNVGKNLTPFNVFKKGILGHPKSYQIKRDVDSGSYGNVVKAVHKPTDDRVAIKYFVDNDESDVQDILKEIQLMRTLEGGPNLLPLRDILREEDDRGNLKHAIVIDYFSADRFSKIYETLTAYEIKKIMYEMIRTLEYAHSKGIMHRDIKPLNVLINLEDLEVRVIDWGFGDFYLPEEDNNVRAGSQYYRAPEMLLGYTKYDYAVDVWSAGCMFADMVFRKYSFFEPDENRYPEHSSWTKSENKIILRRGQLDAYATVLGTKKLKQYANKFKDEMKLDILNYVGEHDEIALVNLITDDNIQMLDSMMLDLLSQMLTFDHTKRITMKEALQHPYFDELRDN